MDVESERSKFQAWFYDETGFQVTRDGASYRGQAHDIWQGWKARAALTEQGEAAQPAAEAEPVAEVIWYDPRLYDTNQKPHKIIDASMGFLDRAPIGTKLYASPGIASQAEENRDVVR